MILRLSRLLSTRRALCHSTIRFLKRFETGLVTAFLPPLGLHGEQGHGAREGGQQPKLDAGEDHFDLHPFQSAKSARPFPIHETACVTT